MVIIRYFKSIKTLIFFVICFSGCGVMESPKHKTNEFNLISNKIESWSDFTIEEILKPEKSPPDYIVVGDWYYSEDHRKKSGVYFYFLEKNKKWILYGPIAFEEYDSIPDATKKILFDRINQVLEEQQK